MAEKAQCPHCGVPFPPRWESVAVNALNPSRDANEHQGDLWTTTCTSCDKPVLEFQPVDGGALGEGTDRLQVFPHSKELSIEIIIEIVLNFEDLRRRNEAEPEMTEDERKKEANTLRTKLRSMKDALFADAYARTTEGLSILADGAQVVQLLGGNVG